MATKQKPKIVRESNGKTQLVIQQITQVSVDRTMKDVATLRDALKAAESIYYPNRTRLYDLYADIDLDGHLTGVMQKRISAVLNKKWEFRRNDKEVEEMTTFIETAVFRNIIKGFVKSIFWGITGFEFIPGDKVVFKEIPRKHIKPEDHVIKVNQSDTDGINYEPLKNILVVGEPHDYGLLLKCAFYAIVKKGNFADWAQYVEIFGQPMRIAKYDANDLKTKEQLTDVLENAGSSLALMIPRQSDFEVMDGKASNGDGQLQERLKNACNNEMSVIIVGNTETTSNDNGGSNAKAVEQGKQQLEITKDDIVFVRNLLNTERFLSILKSYGLPVEGGKFVVEQEIDLQELTLRKDIDSAICKIVPVEDDYFYSTYGIPKPRNYEQLKKKMEEERQMQSYSYQQPEQKQNKNLKAKPAKNIKVSAWDKLRMQLADFFDQAHKD